MTLFQTKKQKEAQQRQQILNDTGIYLEEIQTSQSSNRVFLCFIRACLIFLAVYGTIGSIVSAFSFPCSRILIAAFTLFFSFAIAFLYYNSITFYAGYPVLFFLFMCGIFIFSRHVNSGYQAISNIIFENYSDYFKLASIQESYEYITNRTLTITVTMIFISFLLCLLMNIIISAHMSLPGVFLVTFPFLQTALYINIRPAIPYLAMLLSVYIAVGILGRSGHYKMTGIKNSRQFFSRKYTRHSIRHSYISDGMGMLTTGIYAMLLSTLFLLVTSGLFFSDLNGAKQSRLKAATDQYVKNVVQNGFMSLFDRYDAVGGMANGRLGGVNSVRPDFQPDLEVTFVPYTTDTLYLKSYIGATYISNYFAPVTETAENSAFLQEYDGFADQLHDRGTYARMDIRNVDAYGHYMPYETYRMTSTDPKIQTQTRKDEAVTDAHNTAVTAFHTTTTLSGDLTAKADSGEEYSLEYIPYLPLAYYETDTPVSEEYETYVYDTYMNVPDFLTSALQETAEEAGLWETISLFDHTDVSTYGSEERKQQALRLHLASQIASYFNQNFEYTMAPGATPYNRDTVEYFLTSQKRGFCAHFASSAALLLRSVGIPSRYIEGYSLPISNVNDAEAVSPDTEGWFEGTNSISNAGVIKATLTDAQAHAWVEIYLDGYGWIPYEFTPPSDDNDTSLTLDFMGIFSSLFMTGNANGQRENMADGITDAGEPFQTNFDDTIGTLLWPFLFFVCLITCIALLVRYYPDIKAFFLWRRNLRKGNYTDAILYEYGRLTHAFYRKYRRFPSNQVTETFFRQLREVFPSSPALSVAQSEAFIARLEQAAFSDTPLPIDAYLEMHTLVQQLRAEIRSIGKDSAA